MSSGPLRPVSPRRRSARVAKATAVQTSIEGSRLVPINISGWETPTCTQGCLRVTAALQNLPPPRREANRCASPEGAAKQKMMPLLAFGKHASHRRTAQTFKLFNASHCSSRLLLLLFFLKMIRKWNITRRSLLRVGCSDLTER